MSTRGLVILASGLLAAVAVGFLAAQDRGAQPPASPSGAGDSQAAGDSKSDRADDRAAVMKATRSFVNAFKSGDAKAVASHWTAEGEFISDDGTTLRGRDAIAKSYAEFFQKHPNPEAEVEVQSLRFPSRDTAVEEGYFKVSHARGEAKTVNRYSVLHVREDGKWLMAVVRDWPGEGIALRDLEWLIGTWTSKREEVEVETTYSWALNKSFLRMEFTVKRPDATSSGMQLIGKDPTTGLLRSWTFGSEGGFGQSVWGRDGTDKWVVEAEGVTSEGSIATATNILTRLNNDSFTWQSILRTVDGEDQADIPPIKVTRVKAKK